MPAVLVEVGFITHPTEAKRLVNDNYRKRMASGLADGIERYFANNWPWLERMEYFLKKMFTGVQNRAKVTPMSSAYESYF